MDRGKIVSIERSKGYGFIEMEDGEKVFFHQRWLRKIKFRQLNEGDEVVFTINIGPRGPRAFHLNLADQEIQEIKTKRIAELFKY
nr:cold shock domain-containing protein [candidate division Zixibacteria bacterium]